MLLLGALLLQPHQTRWGRADDCPYLHEVRRSPVTNLLNHLTELSSFDITKYT